MALGIAFQFFNRRDMKPRWCFQCLLRQPTRFLWRSPVSHEVLGRALQHPLPDCGKLALVASHAILHQRHEVAVAPQLRLVFRRAKSSSSLRVARRARRWAATLSRFRASHSLWYCL